ncbi:MAG TPA: DUF4340 domain-containing protein [Tepidisphaeraceae bacterium]|jgi:hypothetical protein
MNFKTTIVLLVLLAAVGVYFGVEHFVGGNKAEETATTDNTKLIPVKSEDVSKVSITSSDGKHLTLVKSGSDWRITEPLDAKADTFAVDDLLRQLTSLQSRGQLKPDQKASLGLDHPKFVVEVTAGAKTSRLSVGDENKIGDSLYVLVDDQQNPQIIATAVYDQLNKQPTDFRSKKLTDLAFGQTNDIKQLSIAQNGKTVRLEKQGSDWQIVEPKKMPADSSAVSSLLSSIADLNATDFVSSPSAPATYGLANPTLTVSYSTAAPTTAPSTTKPTGGHEIAFGRFATIEQNSAYISVDGGPVATIPTSSEDSFKKTALDLRDKKVVDIDPAHVTGFTLSVNRAATTQPTTKPAEQVEYTIARRKETQTLGPTLPAPATTGPTTKPGVASTEPATQPAVASTQPSSKWVIESGGSGDANDANVDALLATLHPLQATKFLESAPTTQPAANYILTVHVGPANGHGPEDYTLKFTNPGTTGEVIGSYEDLTFEVERSILDKLDAKVK